MLRSFFIGVVLGNSYHTKWGLSGLGEPSFGENESYMDMFGSLGFCPTQYSGLENSEEWAPVGCSCKSGIVEQLKVLVFVLLFLCPWVWCMPWPHAHSTL